jgi:hypothetical protein
MDPAFVAEFEQDAQAAASGAELLR